MDKSETYIKMCEKAKKYLPRHKFVDGDHFVYLEAYIGSDIVNNWWIEKGTISIYSSALWGHPPCKLKRLWLPRQDQLQEMVKYFKGLAPVEYSARGLLQIFWEFVDTNWLDYLWTLSNEQVSMEQLWLAFCMSVRYNKIWNGEDWVKEN